MNIDNIYGNVNYKVVDKNLETVLVRLDDFHSLTQNEFQEIHLQYINISKKITSLLKNLHHLQTIFNARDIIVLLDNLKSLKLNLGKNSMSGDFRQELLSDVTSLRYSINKFKKAFRNDFLINNSKTNNLQNADNMVDDLNLRNIITSDLFSIVKILDSALQIINLILDSAKNKDVTHLKETLYIVIGYLEILFNRFLDIQNHFETNLKVLSDKFIISQRIGDEIITSLQFQDIFGQKVVHIIDILKKLKENLTDGNTEENRKKYMELVPEISKILSNQLNTIDNEICEALTSISSKLTHIGDNFSFSEHYIRRLNDFKPENKIDLKDVFVPVKGKKVNGTNGHTKPFHKVNLSISKLDAEINLVINDLLVIKKRVLKVIKSAMLPELKIRNQRSATDEPQLKALYGDLLDLIKDQSINDYNQSKLLTVCNKLFDEVIHSLEDARKGYDKLEIMHEKYLGIHTIVLKLSLMRSFGIRMNASEKYEILDNLKLTYSMQSERIAHEMALKGENKDEVFVETEEEIGEVEFF